MEWFYNYSFHTLIDYFGWETQFLAPKLAPKLAPCSLIGNLNTPTAPFGQEGHQSVPSDPAAQFLWGRHGRGIALKNHIVIVLELWPDPLEMQSIHKTSKGTTK